MRQTPDERRWYFKPRFHDPPATRRGYGPFGWMVVGVVFSALAAAGWASYRRERLLDTQGRPAVGHVMKLDPLSSDDGGGAMVTYRFWVDGDPQKYSHTGTFTGSESPARVGRSMVSSAVYRKTIPVKYLPSNPWVNRPDDPERESGPWYVVIPAVTAAVGWVLCIVESMKWWRRRMSPAALAAAADAGHRGG